MDATGVIPRITWSGATTDVISGLAVSDDELPHGPVRAGSSYEQLQALVAKHQIASLINRYMAVPLDPRMPAYDLGFFLERPGGIGSGRVSARWDSSEEMLASVGLYQLFVAADGAPDQLKVQQQRQLASSEHHLEVVIPGLVDGDGMRSVRAPARREVVQLGEIAAELVIPRIPVQDPLHCGGKLRNKSLKEKLAIGGAAITFAPLLELLAQDASAGAALTLHKSDISLRDRQDCKALMRLVGERVLHWLRGRIPADDRCRPLFYFLQLVRFAVYSFIDPELSVEQRVYQICYSRYFVEGWRLHLLAAGRAAEQCITKNAFDCIIMNMDAMLLFLAFILQNPHLRPVVPFALWRLGTQDLEHGHRDVRRQRKYELCTADEYIARAFLTQVHAEIIARCGHLFRWP